MPPTSNDLQFTVGPTLDDFRMTVLYNFRNSKTVSGLFRGFQSFSKGLWLA